MKQSLFQITENIHLTENVMRMRLKGDTSAITASGQFINIKLDGLFLRRPISVCDCEGDTVTIIYKVVGKGTEQMSEMENGTLDVLTGLGNGYNTSVSGDRPLLIGGGVGVPPMYMLAKKLVGEGKDVTVILSRYVLDSNGAKIVDPTYTNTLTFAAGPYADANPGYKKLHIRSGGADNAREIILRQKGDGTWLLWDQVLLLSIRVPKAADPWA